LNPVDPLQNLLNTVGIHLAGNLMVIAQQGVSDNQRGAQLTHLSFLNLQTHMDIAESYAAQGLERAGRANDFAAFNAADRTPVPKDAPQVVVVPTKAA
jgi:hypothetical protein